MMVYTKKVPCLQLLDNELLAIGCAVMRRRTRRHSPTDYDPIDFYPRCAIPSPNRRYRVSYLKTLIMAVLLFMLSLFFMMTKCKVMLVKLADYYTHENSLSQFSDGPSYTELENKILELKRETELLKQTIEANMDAVSNRTLSLCRNGANQTRENDWFKDIERKIQQALATYDADKIGLFDHAAHYAGGSIVSTPDTVPYLVNQTVEILGLFRINIWSKPEYILQPNALPGECFIFHGTEGKIVIQLGSPVRVLAVTLEHVPHILVEDQSCAPKDFIVLGLHDFDRDGDILGKFTYLTKGNKSVQTFETTNGINTEYSYIMLHVLNNYGHPEYTCIYRFRVHSSKLS